MQHEVCSRISGPLLASVLIFTPLLSFAKQNFSESEGSSHSGTFKKMFEPAFVWPLMIWEAHRWSSITTHFLKERKLKMETFPQKTDVFICPEYSKLNEWWKSIWLFLPRCFFWSFSGYNSHILRVAAIHTTQHLSPELCYILISAFWYSSQV